VFVIDPAASLVVDDTIVVSASANGFLGLKTYSIVLDVAVDIEKPTINIDDVTVGTCTIIIPVEDNVGVDIAATYETLTVEDSTQTDVTKDCEDISDANGTEIKVDVKNLSNGLYTISITAIDLRGNEAAEETITSVFVSGCGENAASCFSVSPTYLLEGTTGDVLIAGINTTFDNTTVVTGCSDVTVGTITLTSDNKLTVSVTAGEVDSDTTCNLTVSTGDEVFTCTGEFQIQDEPDVSCEITVSPSSVTKRLLFPRLATFTVTGNESCDTLGDSSVTFSDTRIWPLRLRETSDGSLEVTVVVWPRATVGPVTMTVGDETTMITVNAFGS